MDLVLYNRIIDTDVEDILDRLHIESHGKYFKELKRKSGYVMCCCPFHSDGQEKHPSSSVYNRTDDSKIIFGAFHCFSCGKSTSLQGLVSKVLNIPREEAKYWLIENFSSKYEDKRLYLESFEQIESQKHFLDESVLNQYSYFHPYQFKRHLTEEVIRKFKIGYDESCNSITFPVWDEDNHLLGITKRNVNNKQFYIPEGLDKPVYLLNFIKQENITEVVVCESQINTLTCWTWGIPAIGLIGTGSNQQYEILNKSGIRSYHLALDGDLAGRHGILRFLKNIKRDVLVDVIDIPKDGRDVNDLSKEEFLSLPRIDRNDFK